MLVQAERIHVVLSNLRRVSTWKARINHITLHTNTVFEFPVAGKFRFENHKKIQTTTVGTDILFQSRGCCQDILGGLLLIIHFALVGGGFRVKHTRNGFKMQFELPQTTASIYTAPKKFLSRVKGAHNWLVCTHMRNSIIKMEISSYFKQFVKIEAFRQRCNYCSTTLIYAADYESRTSSLISSLHIFSWFRWRQTTPYKISHFKIQLRTY